MNSDSFTEGREITLGLENAIDPDLMVAPLDRHLGDEPDIETGRLRIRIGERPLVRNLRTLYELNGRELPSEIEIFYSYEIWLITHAISVIRESGFKHVKKLGYEVSFPTDSQVIVLAVLPQTHFIKKIGALLKNEADIQINGEASVPDSVVQLSDQVENLSLGGQIRMSTQMNVVGRLSFSVMTTSVATTGVGSRRSEWLFNKTEWPIEGDQLMVHILLTERGLKRLNFKAKVYSTISGFNFLPVRLEGDWIELGCDLQ